MTGPSWLVDPKRIATKIKSAAGTYEHSKVQWKSNPTRSCPNCKYIIDNSDVVHEWPGLPRGVKFDPSDQEIIEHLLRKVGDGNLKPHPFINEFILTLEGDDGICYTHPQNLPGVKQDGSVSHFFHKAIKAYNTGTRKRRKIHGEDFGDVRWHKTGRTKPVILDGFQKGCKKIMVLYMTLVRGGKTEKTNWVMHQYHLGTEEDEKDGEYVISKVFYQQQPIIKGSDKNDGGSPEAAEASIVKVDPVTPKSVTPDPPRSEKQSSDFELVQEPNVSTGPIYQHLVMEYVEDDIQADVEGPAQPDQQNVENHPNELMDDNDNQAQEESKWWDSESQHLLDSQQLVEALSLCDDLLQSQSPDRDDNGNDRAFDAKPRLSDYAKLGPEHLKMDIEDCQKIELDPLNIELDTPPDFRLSQLEFGSQDSFLAWGSSKLGD